MSWPQYYFHEAVLPPFDSARGAISQGLAFLGEVKLDNISIAIGDTGEGSVLVIADNQNSVDLINAIKKGLNLSPAAFHAAVCECVRSAGASVFLANDGDLMRYGCVDAPTGPGFTAYSLRKLAA